VSDYDGVQVSGQRDAGKCSAVQLVIVTHVIYEFNITNKGNNLNDIFYYYSKRSLQ